MKKEKFIELAYLYLMDELDNCERVELENVMMQNDDLKNEFENIKVMYSAIKTNQPSEIDETILENMRRTLMSSVRQTSVKRYSFDSFGEKIKFFFFHNYGYALGGAITLVASIGIAYLMFVKNFNQTELGNKPIEIQSQQESHQDQNSIDNSSSNKANTKSDEKLNPTNLRESLINALLQSANAGIRIKSISTISEHSKAESFKPDSKIKNALLTALKKDKNPAVRREALIVLQKFPFDNEIRDALIYVLSKDSNSGMRVAAINALADWNQQEKIIDEILKQSLIQQARTNNNSFVKIRAASILKEVE